MRMTDGNCCRIGGIVRLGDCWQVEQVSYHIPYLLLPRSPISCDCQLDLARSILSDSQPVLNQRQQSNTASLCHRYGCRHILAEEPLLDSCLLWTILSNDRSKLLIDLLQTLRVSQSRQSHDDIADDQT